ncbi:MAG: hypothetical protein ACQEQI_03310 [Bacillota bacterium]
MKIIGVTVLLYIINFYQRRVDNNLEYLVHPIIVAPLGGALLGNLSTGIYIGLLLELIWGINLVESQFGLQFINLTALLATSLTLLTANISLLFNLTLALLISYLLQVIMETITAEIPQWLVEGGLLLFLLTCLSFTPILQKLLGAIPAQFLDQLARVAGLLPIIGGGVILAQVVVNQELSSRKAAYLFALVVTTITSLYNINLVPVVFLLTWGISWQGLTYFKLATVKQRLLLGGLIILTIPGVVELSSPLLATQLQLVLWSEALLSLVTLLLLRFSITQFELYFLFLIIGTSLGRAGLLL